MKSYGFLILCFIVFFGGCIVMHQKPEKTECSKETIDINGMRIVIKSENALDLKSEVKVVNGQMMIIIDRKKYEKD